MGINRVGCDGISIAFQRQVKDPQIAAAEIGRCDPTHDSLVHAGDPQWT